MNKKFWVLMVSVILAGILLAACGGGGPAETPTPTEPQGNATAGQAKFESTCKACHGVDLKGMAGLGKDLTTSQYVKDKTNSQMLAFLLVGRAADDALNTTGVAMPPKGGNPSFTDQDLLDIIAYVRSKQ
jgi:mono/diheme cytochrome c family protein